jgi:hypothetical protein
MCRLNQNNLLMRMPPLLPNWTADLDCDAAGRIALDEAIPLVYVPPVDIVIALRQAASAADRLAIVGAERDAIADACLKILRKDRSRPPFLSSRRLLKRP